MWRGATTLLAESHICVNRRGVSSQDSFPGGPSCKFDKGGGSEGREKAVGGEPSAPGFRCVEKGGRTPSHSR